MLNKSESANQALTEACVVLGLAPPFTAEQAKSRYRELAKLYHPDVGLIKDSSRFAEISRAYDLVEANIHKIGSLKLGAATAGDTNRAKLNDLLQELHVAKTQTIHAEAQARQMADEAEALRRFYSATRTGSRKGFWLAALVAVATAGLGFMAGLLWSYQSPIMSLKPGTRFEGLAVSGSEVVTTGPLQNQPNFIVQISPNDQLQVDVTFSENEAKVVNNRGVITVESTPTVTLRKAEHQYTLLQVTPAPTPTPPPAPVPPQMPQASTPAITRNPTPAPGVSGTTQSLSQ